VELTAFEKEAVKDLYSGKHLIGEGGVHTSVIERIVLASLEGDVHAHLAQEEEVGNRRSGYTHKKLRTSVGRVEVSTPRDRSGTFEPQLVGKRQRVLNDELDKKILGLYGLGLSYHDISTHIREMYQVEVSDAT